MSYTPKTRGNCGLKHLFTLHTANNFSGSKATQPLKKLCHRPQILKKLANFFYFVVRNPFSVIKQSLFIFGFLLQFWCYSTSGNYYFEISFNLKVNLPRFSVLLISKHFSVPIIYLKETNPLNSTMIKKRNRKNCTLPQDNSAN